MMRQNKDYPQNHAKNDCKDKSMMEGVYAGPDFFAQQPPEMMQAAYAGPVFNNPAMFQMAYAGPAPQPSGGMWIGSPPLTDDAKPRKWCHACGMTIDADAKFCTECGAPQPKDDA